MRPNCWHICSLRRPQFARRRRADRLDYRFCSSCRIAPAISTPVGPARREQTSATAMAAAILLHLHRPQ
jgi:hypothetical protein